MYIVDLGQILYVDGWPKRPNVDVDFAIFLGVIVDLVIILCRLG